MCHEMAQKAKWLHFLTIKRRSIGVGCSPNFSRALMDRRLERYVSVRSMWAKYWNSPFQKLALHVPAGVAARGFWIYFCYVRPSESECATETCTSVCLQGTQRCLTAEKSWTIENPHTNHTIGNQGCSWTTTLKNCLGAILVLIRHLHERTNQKTKEWKNSEY